MTSRATPSERASLGKLLVKRIYKYMMLWILIQVVTIILAFSLDSPIFGVLVALEWSGLIWVMLGAGIASALLSWAYGDG